MKEDKWQTLAQLDQQRWDPAFAGLTGEAPLWTRVAGGPCSCKSIAQVKQAPGWHELRSDHGRGQEGQEQGQGAQQPERQRRQGSKDRKFTA